jgi:hypothetical protein
MDDLSVQCECFYHALYIKEVYDRPPEAFEPD